MATNDYHFITHWLVEGTIEEVSAILADAESLLRWWPAVYLEVKTLKEGDANNIGKEIFLRAKGWLPYSFSWKFCLTGNHAPKGFTLEASGEFNGRGVWTLEQQGKMVAVIYDWEVRVQKPLLEKFAFLMKPIFSANHNWAMRKGEESLKLELLRKRAKTPEELAAIPQPPPATFRWMV